MHKILFLFLVAIPMLYLPPLDGFLDAFVVYGRRNNRIKEMISEALKTDDTTWVEHGLAYPYETFMRFTFVPEKQDQELTRHPMDLASQEIFSYTEYDFKKEEPSIVGLESFLKEITSEKDSMYHSCSEKIRSKSDSEIQLEIYLNTKPQIISSTVLKDGVKVPSETITKNPANLTSLYKVISKGNRKYILYSYQTRCKDLSEAEKDYWFQMFDYLRIDF